MGKRLIIFFIITAIIISAIVVTVIIVTKPKTIGGRNIELETQYYMKSMQSGLYRYDDDKGMAGDEIIRYQNNDTSYCEFSNNWKIFKIHFMDKEEPLIFVVTSIKVGKKGNIKANITHLYNGEIYSYRVRATKEYINLIAAATYHVGIATNDYTPGKDEEIFLEDTTIMIFFKNTPEYIKEAE